MSNSITLPKDQEITPELLKRLNQLPAINIYRLLTLTPACFNPWLDLIGGLYQLKFSMRLREIAICRQAYNANSKYELHQHTFIAKQNGVTEEELQIITSENPVSSLDEEANFICKAADEIEKTATLSDDTFAKLVNRYEEQGALEFILILSSYCCVARVLNCSRIPIEKDNPLAKSATPMRKS